jgi:O-antigen ligase
MASNECDDQQRSGEQARRHAERAAAFALPGSGVRPDGRRDLGALLLYVVPAFCLVSAIGSRSAAAAVAGVVLLVALLLLQDRWGLRRRAPQLGSGEPRVAALGWGGLVLLALAAFWVASRLS